MIQNAKTTFWEEIQTRLELWKELLKDPIVATGQSFEVRGEFVLRLTIGSRLVVELVFNGLLPRGLRHGAKGVGQTFVRKSLVLLGSLGQCAFAHSIHALECLKEVGPHCELFLFGFQTESHRELVCLQQAGVHWG